MESIESQSSLKESPDPPAVKDWQDFSSKTTCLQLVCPSFHFFVPPFAHFVQLKRQPWRSLSHRWRRRLLCRSTLALVWLLGGGCFVCLGSQEPSSVPCATSRTIRSQTPPRSPWRDQQHHVCAPHHQVSGYMIQLVGFFWIGKNGTGTYFKLLKATKT